MWDSVTALTLMMAIAFDKTAWKQALIALIAILTHITIVVELTIKTSALSLFVYNNYTEVIILIGISQMMVSYNGFISAYRNLRHYLSGFANSSKRIVKSRTMANKQR